VSNSLSNNNAHARGLEYLREIQRLALEPGMVEVMCSLSDRTAIYIWIGNNIDAVNTKLQTHLEACHQCFHPGDLRPMQIFAAPFASHFGIDGICNLLTTPTTILIDVGRVPAKSWLGIVAHEYAHAHVGNFGHHREFAKALSHLCLGLGIKAPPTEPESQLRSWPPCSSNPDPLAFWKGLYE
jgi:hypothetical protein